MEQLPPTNATTVEPDHPHKTGAAFFNTNQIVDELDGKSPWFAFADSISGNLVYFNQITGERTWTKPPTATFQYVTGTMPSGLSGDPEMLGEDFEEHPYMQPSKEFAIEYSSSMIFEQGLHPFCHLTNFSSLGIGIQGYFVMLRFLIGMFCILSILVSPLIVMYSQGEGLGKLSSSFGFGQYTLGNIQKTIEGNAVPMAVVWGEAVPLVPNAAEYISWTVFTAAMVFFIGWTGFSIYIQKMSSQEDSAVTAMDDYTVVVWNLPPDACKAEIAVHFSNLYNLQHDDFMERLAPGKPGTGGTGGTDGQMGQHDTNGALPNPLFYPTTHTGNLQKDTYKGMWISDLSVGHPNGHLIRSFNEHSDLNTSLRIQRALFKKHRAIKEGGIEPNEKLCQQAWLNVCKIETDLNNLSALHKTNKCNNGASPEDVVNAYVTFNNQESFRRCYEDYANTRRHPCCRMWWKKIPLPLLFNGEESLVVDRAPDPSDILWENLEKTDSEIFKQQIRTKAVTVVLLVMNFGIVFTAFYYANEFSSLINNDVFCNEVLPSIHYTLPINSTLASFSSFGTNKFAPKLSRVGLDSGEIQAKDLKCRDIDSALFQSTGNAKTNGESYYYDVRYTKNWTSNNGTDVGVGVVLAPPVYNVSACQENWCNTVQQQQKCPCIEVSETISKSNSFKSCTWVNPSKPTTATTASSGVAALKEMKWNGRDVQNCYCSGQLGTYMAKGGSLTDFILKERAKVEGGSSSSGGGGDGDGGDGHDGGGFCSRFAYLFALSRGLMIMSVSMVSLLNVILEEVVKVVATWEHSHTLSAQAAAIMSKVFIGIYLNTAFILIVVNLKIPGVDISRGSHNGFTPEWYGSIGASLTLTMLMDIFMPHVVPTITIFIVKPLLRRFNQYLSPRFTTPPVTQKQINDMYSGIEFELPIRVAYVLNTVSIAITFVSGIPLMLIFATISLCLSYVVDRWFLLRFYRKGVVYDNKILAQTWNLIPFVAILSLAMSIYMLTEVSIFPINLVKEQESSLLFMFNVTSNDLSTNWLHARLSRSWSFPLFVILVGSVVLLIVKAITAQFVDSVVDIDVFRTTKGLLYCCRCCRSCRSFCCCCGAICHVCADVNLAVRIRRDQAKTEVVGGKGEGEVDLIAEEQNAMLMEQYMHLKPAFTDLALKKIFTINDISTREMEEGWCVVRHLVSQTLYKAKVWPTDGASRISGLPHKKGDVMRVYDDISQTRLTTYRIESNPRYRAAVQGLHLARKKRNEFIDHHGNIKGAGNKDSQKHFGLRRRRK